MGVSVLSPRLCEGVRTEVDSCRSTPAGNVRKTGRALPGVRTNAFFVETNEKSLRDLPWPWVALGGTHHNSTRIVIPRTPVTHLMR